MDAAEREKSGEKGIGKDRDRREKKTDEEGEPVPWPAM